MLQHDGHRGDDEREALLAPCYEYHLAITGMTCEGCVELVTEALGQLPGVVSADVSLAPGRAHVTASASVAADALVRAVRSCSKKFSAELCAPDEAPRPPPPSAPRPAAPVVVAVTSLGAEQRQQQQQQQLAPASSEAVLELAVGGMTCAACSARVGAAARALGGVTSCDVNLLAGTALVRYDPARAGAREIVGAIESAGYRTSPAPRDARARAEALSHSAEIRGYRLSFLASAVFAVPMLGMMVAMMASQRARDALMTRVYRGVTVEGLAGLALATPVQLYLGRSFYVRSYRALRHGSATMDVLVALGTNAAYVFSVVSLALAAARPHYHAEFFFETSVLLITFIMMGRWLESVAKGRTSLAVTRLLELRAATALLVVPGQDDKEIDADLVQRGDTLKVLPGSKVPADGVVLSGSTSVDESMLTGESMPVAKSAGDGVVAGTLNLNGTVLVEATKIGAETFLSQIVSLVQTAQLSKAPIQELADKVSSVFVPFVIAVALLTWAVWFTLATLGVGKLPQWIERRGRVSPFIFSFLFAVATVVVACPCAMGLATPTAVMVGTGVAARRGVLIKNASSFERANRIGVIVFDKTGTLTAGKPVVTDVCPYGSTPADELLRVAASAESSSEHPIARAITEEAKRRGASASPAENYEALAGEGLRCTVDGHSVLIGKHTLFPTLPADHAGALSRLESQGKTCITVSVDGAVVGAIALADSPRPEAREVVSKLKAMGIIPWMITGDNQRTANCVAEAVGIIPEHVLASVLPQHKATRVAELQAMGHKVAMVGDGINDSPALAQADLGIAIGAGTDIAIETASVVLVQSDLRALLGALDISRRTFQRIRLNFLWAFGYNVVLIPVAAGALYPLTNPYILPPYLAGLIMAFSSVSVVCSSLLLNVDLGKCRRS
eukprot:m51a1_g5762 putative p-type atpase (905) ;mRNA; f:1217681-1221048